MTDLGTAYVQIVPSAQGIKGSIEKAIGGEASSAGKSAGKSIVSSIKTAIVAAGIGKIVKDALSAGGNLEQSFGGLETIYGDAAAGAKEYAAAAAEAGISANSYAEQAVSFGAALKKAYKGDTLKAMEAANTAILDMADNSAKMGTDIGAVQAAYQGFAKQNYTMLDNLKLGYGGTKTEMERLLADAQKLSGVKYDINNLGDVYDAIHVIQEDLGLTGVAADEAKTTLTGSSNAMKASWENLMAVMTSGQGDMSAAMSSLGISAANFGSNLIRMVGNLGRALPQLFTGVFTTLGPQLIPLASQTIGNIASGITTGLPKVATAMTGLLPQIETAFTTTLPQMITEGGNIINSVVSGITTALPDLLTAGMEMTPKIVSGLVQTIPTLLASGNQILNTILSGITSSLPELLNSGQSMVTELISGVAASLPDILTEGASIITTLLSGIVTTIPQLMTAGGNILTTIIGGITTALPGLLTAGSQVVPQLISGIVQAIPTLLSGGMALVTTILSGITSNLPQLVSGAAKIVASLVGGIATNLPDILQSGIGIMGQLIAGIIGAIGDLVAALPQIFDAAKSAFSGFDWRSLGKALIDGIVNGIKNGLGSITSALSEMAKSAWESAKNFFKVGSPSKLFEEDIGRWIPAGVAVGVEKNLDPINSAMSEMADAAIYDFKRATASGNSVQSTRSDDTDRMIDAMRNLRVKTEIHMDANARKMLRVVEKENNTRTRATNYNVLSRAAT